MPFTKPDGTRDYKRERAWEKKNGDKRGKERAARNKARREAGLKVGDPREADHIKPLSLATTEDEVIRLCHYKNLQPLWKIDNLKKGDKIIVPQNTTPF